MSNKTKRTKLPWDIYVILSLPRWARPSRTTIVQNMQYDKNVIYRYIEKYCIEKQIDIVEEFGFRPTPTPIKDAYLRGYSPREASSYTGYSITCISQHYKRLEVLVAIGKL